MVRLSIYLLATAAILVGTNALSQVEDSDNFASLSQPEELSYQENAAPNPSDTLKEVLDALKKLPPLPEIKNDPNYNNVDLDKLKDVVGQIADVIDNSFHKKPTHRHEMDDPFDNESEYLSDGFAGDYSQSVKAVLKARGMYEEEAASTSADAPDAEVSSPTEELDAVVEDDTLTQAGLFDSFGQAPAKGINISDLNKQIASVSKAFSAEVVKHSKEIEEIASLLNQLAKAQKEHKTLN